MNPGQLDAVPAMPRNGAWNLLTTTPGPAPISGTVAMVHAQVAALSALFAEPANT